MRIPEYPIGAGHRVTPHAFLLVTQALNRPRVDDGHGAEDFSAIIRATRLNGAAAESEFLRVLKPL